MGFQPPKKIAQIAVETGKTKAELPLQSMLLLGFLGGAFIAIGYLLYIRVTGDLPAEWGSFGQFLGAAVFPLGLVLIIVAGGELLTGNMVAVTIACLHKKITAGQLFSNWFWITISNFVGALFVAYVFGHLVGLTETGPFLDKTVHTAAAKIETGFWQSFFSAIGCNWLVGLAVWQSYGAEDISGKILAVWFPIMGFVAIGFQHVVANMFIIPAAIFAGHADWGDYIQNFVPVFLGNAAGGALFVALIYWLAYLKADPTTLSDKKETYKA
ncbi:formate/nitrite transporter family protein [Domibacillus sp. PGB-M46]|uniref:formate/nitrite transporter family protein n=1 Tax=Domibacillus sp. PGB-M46 TaxID=2910255 RepID=UPI001F5A9844|nr:formate/nitrite transporter family protein [Domibacillus sp. PGB-M46]MCI2256381.1 formate/nitrite transporter family protein [Domibacillus sp. PGB-M46]